MPLAVDKSAIVTEADFEKIMEHVRAGWEWELSKKKIKPKDVKNYKDEFFNLTIERIIE